MTKGTENDDGKLLRVLKCLRCTPEIGLVLDGKDDIAHEVLADAPYAILDYAIARIGNESVLLIRHSRRQSQDFTPRLSSTAYMRSYLKLGKRRIKVAQGYSVGIISVSGYHVYYCVCEEREVYIK